MLLHLSELAPEPLHQQLSRQLRARILARELLDGELLPSIRVLARDHRVSVITVQRAYEDLEREGLLVSRPGKGFFVAPQPEGQRRRVALARLHDALGPPVAAARAEGLQHSDILEVFTHVLDAEGGTQ
ncbi:MAG: GntR family transcriptional regulator [Thermoanaerobaculaceae bacterium]